MTASTNINLTLGNDNPQSCGKSVSKQETTLTKVLFAARKFTTKRVFGVNGDSVAANSPTSTRLIAYLTVEQSSTAAST